MKNNWQIKKLSDICSIVKGKKPVLFNEQKENMLPYLGAKFLRGTKDAEFAKIDDKGSVLVDENDLIIICDGSKSGDIFSGFRGILSSTMGKMTIDENLVDGNFLRRFLDLNFELFNGSKKGAAIPHLDFYVFKNLEILLPSLATQQKIVARLDELLGNIAEAKRLRQEAIGDTEKILSQTLREIFEEGKEKGWEEKTLEEVAPIKRETNKKLLPYVGMEDVESATGKFLGNLEPRKVQSNTFYFDDTCVLYGRLRPYLNKVLVPDFEGHCSTEMFPLVPKKDILLKQYLFYWVTQGSFINDAMRTAGGARMPRANMKEVMKFKILIPPLPLQHQIVTQLDTLSSKLRELRQLQAEQLEDLKKLEKAYLREAFNGELV